ncbi:MAG: hypothetical protein HZB18_07955 [Chloroflexi bacterium]|nr:hypothetical protein [Chloroflexota bacterium]
MTIWTDGLNVLLDRAWVVFSILIPILWGNILFGAALRKIFKTQFTDIEYFSLGMAGWVLPSSLWAALMLAGTFLFGEAATIAVSALAVVVFLFVLFSGKPKRASIWHSLALTALLAVSLVLQLAFLEKTILPLYFDSAEHYRIINYLADTYNLSAIDTPSTAYYHFGFHLWISAISRVFQPGIVNVMLVFGQVMLAILPFSLFFIAKQETQSNAAAFFICLLAGLGWHMPSHLMNWGKYPALFSLVGIHFVLNVGYLIYRNDTFKHRQSALYGLLGLGILISALIHTRSLVVFAFAALSVLLTIWRKTMPAMVQHFLFALVACLILIEIVFIQKSGVLSLLFGAYLRDDIWMIALVAVLMFFSIKFYSELTFFLLASLSLLMLGLFVPVHFPSLGGLTLLDRPYVQMLFYLPLSIFGGLGLAGLHQTLQRFSFHPKLLTRFTTLLIFGLVALNAGLRHHFYPSDCCQIVSRDDLAAFQWMDTTLPSNARILTASTDLYVTSFESANTLAGVDGGVWIAPLISRKTIRMRWDVNFAQPETHDEICAQELDYIYVGGMRESFSVPQLAGRPNGYLEIFALPKAKVYQVIGCE